MLNVILDLNFTRDREFQSVQLGGPSGLDAKLRQLAADDCAASGARARFWIAENQRLIPRAAVLRRDNVVREVRVADELDVAVTVVIALGEILGLKPAHLA